MNLVWLFPYIVMFCSGNFIKSGDGRMKSIIETEEHIAALRVKRASANTNATTCTKEYQEFPGHTMCMGDNPGAIVLEVSPADKALIVEMHNTFRGTVYPPAMDLMKLTYDENLAVVAEKWASQCIMGHDETKDIPGYGPGVGQNVAGGYQSWHAAIEAWHDEVVNYTYGKDPFQYRGPNALREIGHYTQIVCNRTTRVGCGAAYCEDSLYGWYYVCNYFRGQSDAAHPYKKGKRCKTCPNTCVNGECDCKGKTCFNGGTLNPDTCQCSCYKLYQGDTCENLVCPTRDLRQCGRTWPVSFCEIYANVPYLCPYMCGKCGEAPKESMPNTTFVSEFGCSYDGKRDDAATCKEFGAEGQDKRYCGSKGGELTCGHCKKFSNVMTSFCPVMCGLCDPPCGGKECKNGGKLSTSTCMCLCVNPYSGDFCEKLSCPPNDEYYCRFVSKADCSFFYNVPQECPHRCGICKKW